MFIYFLGYLLYNIILYEVKTMNNYIIPKPKLILNWIIFFISLLFLSFGIISNSKSLHYQILGTKTEARILRVVNTTDDSLAKIRYKCGNKLYDGIIENVDDSFSVGDYVTIYYMKDDPTDFIYLSNNGFLSITIIILSLSLFVFYFVKIIKIYKYFHKVKITMECKNIRKLKITNIELIEKEETFGTTPYKITCKLDDKEYVSQLIYDNTKDPFTLIGYNVNIYYYQNFYFFDPSSYER